MKSFKRPFLLALIVSISFLLGGCLSGNFQYVEPDTANYPSNSVIVDKSKNEVWAEIVPALGREFFVINNIDKDSGLLNISYSGDPERYVDCGRITSYVSNARGPRTYEFPAASRSQKYEYANNGYLYQYDRKMDLVGRMNLIVQEAGDNKSLVTANTKYVVTKRLVVHDLVFNKTQSDTSTASFNSGQSGEFEGGTICRPTGKFEEEVLSLVSSHDSPPKP